MRKKNRNSVIIFLVMCVCFLTTTYAIFAQPVATKTLTVSEAWNIGFTNVVQSGLYGNAKEVTPVDFTSNSSMFNIRLNGNGDKITYDFTIKNKGVIDAKVESISVLPPNVENDTILFKTDGLKVGDELDAGDSAEMQVVAYYNPKHQGKTNAQKDVMILVNYAQK